MMKTTNNLPTGIPLNKVVFLGTPVFAVPSLELLSLSEYKPVLVVTQPDRKQGRNMRLTAPPIKQIAIEYEIELMQPEDINEEYVVDRIAYLQPDIIITVAFGGLLKKELLNLPRYGCINLHPSLLPKYRGASPINYTLFNGNTKTGNSIIKLVKKMDSGPLLHQSFLNVQDDDNASTLADKLARQGAEDILQVLRMIEEGTITEIEQNEAEATYSKKIEKADALISWQESAQIIFRKVRGLAEEPGAFTIFRGQRLKILRIKPLQKSAGKAPGTIIAAGDISVYDRSLSEKGILVATADRDVLIELLQPAGKRDMTAFEFNLGAKITPGERFTGDKQHP